MMNSKTFHIYHSFLFKKYYLNDEMEALSDKIKIIGTDSSYHATLTKAGRKYENY